jgi:hypothetical protein
MVTLDRIRLTGLLRKKPWKRGFFYPRAGAPTPDDDELGHPEGLRCVVEASALDARSQI